MTSKRLIYVVCPDRTAPIGGIKQLYRLVDILNLGGYDAYIVHAKNNFRVKWFENSTPIKYFPNLFAQLSFHKRKKKKLRIPLVIRQAFINKSMPEPNSVVILPEIYGPKVLNLVPKNKVIIFNQNCYYTFNNFENFKKQESAYTHPNTLGSIVVSSDSLSYLKYVFSNLEIYRVRLGIGKIFQYYGNKKKQIAFMPRKLTQDSNQIIQIIQQRLNLTEWKFVAIDNMSETEVSKALRDSMIFMSFNYMEGFGLPPVEAMACGCYVIGYTGRGGNEYFKPEFSTPIEDGNVIQFAQEMERIIDLCEKAPQEITDKGLAASQFVLKNYNLSNETTDILNVFDKLLQKVN